MGQRQFSRIKYAALSSASLDTTSSQHQVSPLLLTPTTDVPTPSTQHPGPREKLLQM